jgi:Ran GTPase-activating protein (RanGAP) involved in mRNA processing and transport
MIRHAVTAALLFSVVAGCSGKTDPAVRVAAERIVKLGGSFTLSGLTVPVKTADKIPLGNLNITKVSLNSTHAKDADMELLKPLTQVEILELQSSDITDTGLGHLKDLKTLRELDLHDCQHISEKGLESLQGLSRLTKLEVSKTPINDAAVDRLSSMKQLSQLYLNNTRLTSAAGKKIREALPKCKIYGPK